MQQFIESQENIGCFVLEQLRAICIARFFDFFRDIFLN